MAEIPILLLAAGASSRMGRAKALLPWGEGTLIEHQVNTLLKISNVVLVILGHQPDQILPVLKKYPVRVSVNQHWKEGMGSSIAHGIGQLKKESPEAAGVLITQLDQPLITSAHFDKMLSVYLPESRQIIVSQSPAGWQGVPVLFDRMYFKELQELNGEGGAQRIFRSRLQAVKVVESEDILEDMDTPEAYQELLVKHGPSPGAG